MFGVGDEILHVGQVGVGTIAAEVSPQRRVVVFGALGHHRLQGGQLALAPFSRASCPGQEVGPVPGDERGEIGCGHGSNLAGCCAHRDFSAANQATTWSSQSAGAIRAAGGVDSRRLVVPLIAEVADGVLERAGNAVVVFGGDKREPVVSFTGRLKVYLTSSASVARIAAM
jgi:hypothetical protein